MQSLAIIGAGIAGCSLARMLASHYPDLRVTVFDKSRGLGGRMATRRSNMGEFDHGARFFTVRTDAFRDFLADYGEDLAPWDARVTTLSPSESPYKRIWFEPHLVAVPQMNSLCRSLLAGIEFQPSHHIESIASGKRGWMLRTQASLLGPFDWVVSTAPAPQSASILDIDLTEVRYDPVFTMMLPLRSRPTFDAAVVKDACIEWIAVGSSRPGRTAASPIPLVVHAAADWSKAHLEMEPASLRDPLTAELKSLGISDFDPAAAQVHRWRYARVVDAFHEDCWIDPAARLAACGDWCVGPTVEDAFTSANTLFQCISREMSLE